MAPPARAPRGPPRGAGARARFRGLWPERAERRERRRGRRVLLSRRRRARSAPARQPRRAHPARPPARAAVRLPRPRRGQVGHRGVDARGFLLVSGAGGGRPRGVPHVRLHRRQALRLALLRRGRLGAAHQPARGDALHRGVALGERERVLDVDGVWSGEGAPRVRLLRPRRAEGRLVAVQVVQPRRVRHRVRRRARVLRVAQAHAPVRERLGLEPAHRQSDRQAPAEAQPGERGKRREPIERGGGGPGEGVGVGRGGGWGTGGGGGTRGRRAARGGGGRGGIRSTRRGPRAPAAASGRGPGPRPPPATGRLRC